MRKIFYIFTISLFVLTSCEKNELKTLEINKKADSMTINSNINVLSSLIAKAAGDNLSLRKLIKEEVGKKFDYDYDALLVTFIGKEIAGEKFEEILANHSDGKYTSEQITNIIKSSGYLQISIPVLFDEFNPNTDKPLTVAIPVDINEKTIESFDAYNSEGSLTSISAKTAPEKPTLVIMESERVDENGNLKVNENGMYLEKNKRIHYSKALKQDTKQEVAKSNKPKLIEVLSNEDYDSFIKLNERKEALKKPKMIQCVNNSTNLDIIGNLLLATAMSVNKVELQWQAVEGANRFVIKRSGNVKINGAKTYKTDLIIADLRETYTKTDIVDYSNEEYSYYVSYYNDNVFLGQSYVINIHSSHRKSGGMEFVKKIVASKKMVEILEGWWASEIEIKAQIVYINSNNELSNAGDVGFVIPTAGTGMLRPIDWTGNNSLFTWDRAAYNCGSYTIALEETDTSDRILDNLEIAVGFVHFLPPGEYSVIIKEVFSTLQETIKILDKPDYIATFHVKWWDPQDFLRQVNSNGFSIIIDHDSTK